MRLQFEKASGPLPFAITANLRHCDLCVVMQDRPRHDAVDGKGAIVPIAKGLGRVSLDEKSVRVRKRYRETGQLSLDAADPPKHFDEIDLRVPRPMCERQEHLPLPSLFAPAHRQ